MTSTRTHGRRWPRLVIPYAVVAIALIGSFVAYRLQRPDLTNHAYLSPTSNAEIGGSRLAAMVAGHDVRIDRVTTTADALATAASATSAVTVFVPTPALVHPFYLRMIKLLPASARVVLVAPDARVLSLGLLPADASYGRLAAKAVAPECGYAPAARSGAAGVRRFQYAAADALQSCYGGSLTVIRRGASEVTLIGSDDPFRNDRIGEHHNAELATALLTSAPTVIWLDLHHAERRPGYVDNPALANQQPAPPSLGPGSPDPDFPLPSGYVTHKITKPHGGQGKLRPGPSNPLWQAFPGWVFAAFALTALAAILLALARGRRLGSPVTEPLPITVRAAETVEGRGRLYQRAKARGPAAEVLREHASTEIKRLLGLEKQAHPVTVVAAVVAETGWPKQLVVAVLYGDAPTDDRELIRTALDIEALLNAVRHHTPPRPLVPEGELR